MVASSERQICVEVIVSASLNKVMIIGNLGRDPELRTTEGGQSVATLNVATTDTWVDKSGNKQERTEWHRVVVWGRQGENAAKYLKKGRSVYVEGRIQTREYTDKEGVKKYATDVVADTVQFLGGAAGGGGGESEGGGGYGGGNRGGGGGGGGARSGGAAGGGAAAGGGRTNTQSEDDAPARDQGGAGGGNFNDDDIPF